MKKQKNERISLKNYKKRLQTRFLLCIILIKQEIQKRLVVTYVKVKDISAPMTRSFTGLYPRDRERMEIVK